MAGLEANPPHSVHYTPTRTCFTLSCACVLQESSDIVRIQSCAPELEDLCLLLAYILLAGKVHQNPTGKCLVFGCALAMSSVVFDWGLRTEFQVSSLALRSSRFQMATPSLRDAVASISCAPFGAAVDFQLVLERWGWELVSSSQKVGPFLH